MSIKFQSDPAIDGHRDKALVVKILLHVAENSRVFNSLRAARKLDAFDGYDEGRVFLHYVMLIDAGFIVGNYDIQSGGVIARYLSWAGHELLETLRPPMTVPMAPRST